MTWEKSVQLGRNSTSPFYDGNYPLGNRPAGTFKIRQHGIEWEFNQTVEAGAYCNGDLYVIAKPGLQVVAITPAWDGVKHGAMVNPTRGDEQGFDDRMQYQPVNAANNAAQNLPIDCSSAKSIVSSISNIADSVGHDPQLLTAAVLTIVDSAPAVGSFRPPYGGTDKTVIATESDLNYGALGSYSSAGIQGIPDLAATAQQFSRPWIEFVPNWIGRYTHPALNMPTYGREIAEAANRGTLSLQLDYTNAEKRDLLVGVVQAGIDIYGAAKAGMTWINDGGHNQGRKMLMLLAAKVLNHTDMLDWCDAQQHFIFQEDNQTFYVSQETVDQAPLQGEPGKPRSPYTVDMIGTPEWGEKHLGSPWRDGSNWDAAYRTIAGSPAVGSALAAKLMNAQSDWNWPAFFDYIETRYWPTEKDNALGETNRISVFAASMWNTHIGGA